MKIKFHPGMRTMIISFHKQQNYSFLADSNYIKSFPFHHLWLFICSTVILTLSININTCILITTIIIFNSIKYKIPYICCTIACKTLANYFNENFKTHFPQITLKYSILHITYVFICIMNKDQTFNDFLVGRDYCG